MRRFISYLGTLVLVSVLLLIALEIGYTYVYNTQTPRNKVMWMRELKGEQLDYLILGSSRANNHIDAKRIYEFTGNKGYNLGVNGFGAFETHLMLKEFLKNNTTKRVFVQVDDGYRKNYPDAIGEKVWLPFIYERSIFEEFDAFGVEYSLYRYLPFYRYLKFESRLGYRDVLTSLFGKGYDYDAEWGYTPNTSSLTSDKAYTKNHFIRKRNSAIDKIIKLCQRDNIALFFFTAPMYNYKGDMSALHKYVPRYINFIDSIPQIDKYGDNTHLNYKGAQIFTDIFIKTYFEETP